MIKIPDDSFLRYWIAQFDNTEVWESWRLAIGLGIIGTILERNAMFSYGEAGRVWPNTSVMLIGKSGDGKDTIIAAGEKVLRAAGANFIAGTTIEGVKESLWQLSNRMGSAVGYILAPELSNFIGTKDYQQGIITGLTDLLSNNATVDISTKTDLITRGRPKVILNPTLTLFAGTTPDWLPEECIGGGFLGRFIVAPELGAKKKHVPNPGKYDSIQQRDFIREAKERFLACIIELRKKFPKGEVKVFHEDMDGEDFFTNWYINRRSHFSINLEAFAARSGNLMRKIAMLMAVSRSKSFLSIVDYEFASALIEHAAQQLERGVIPPSREVAVSYVILDMLPATRVKVVLTLSPKFSSLWVKRGLDYLVETEQVIVKDGMVIKKEIDA